MIRILQCVNIMDRAGLENMLMNYYRNIDRTKIQFDFLTHRKEKGAYEDEILSMGGRVYHAPRLYPQNYPAYFKWMKEFFDEHPEYTIVHSHIDAMSFFPLLAAKKAGIPVRIAHSHNTKIDKDIKFPIKYFALKRIPSVATGFCACGEKAGKFMCHDRDFIVIHNAIDLKKFKYNDEIREKKRIELKIPQECFVIGHVGRYSYVKNQLFLIDVFREVLKSRPQSCLILVGNGADEEKIVKKICDYGIKDKVLLLRDRDDVDEIYQVFDIFVMPSLFEGLPLVGVEAQANGLKCLFSDKISDEIILTSRAESLPIDDGINTWCNKIILSEYKRSELAFGELEKNGYNIVTEVKKLDEFYSYLSYLK